MLVITKLWKYYQHMSEAVSYTDPNSYVGCNLALSWLQGSPEDETPPPAFADNAQKLMCKLSQVETFDPAIAFTARRIVSMMDDSDQRAAGALLLAGYDLSTIKGLFKLKPQTIRRALDTLRSDLQPKPIENIIPSAQIIELMKSAGVLVVADQAAETNERLISPEETSPQPPVSPPSREGSALVQPSDAQSVEPVVLSVAPAEAPAERRPTPASTGVAEEILLKLIEDMEATPDPADMEYVAERLLQFDKTMPTSAKPSHFGLSPLEWRALSLLSGHMPAGRVPVVAPAEVKRRLQTRLDTLQVDFDAVLFSAFEKIN